MAAQAVAPPLCVCTPFVVVYYSCMNRKARALTHSKLPPTLLTPNSPLTHSRLLSPTSVFDLRVYYNNVPRLCTPGYSPLTHSRLLSPICVFDLRVYNNVPRLCTHCHACCCLLCASFRACACASCVGIISGLSTFRYSTFRVRYSTFRTFRYAACVSLLRTKTFAASEVNL